LAVYCIDDVHMGAPNAIAFAAEDAQRLTGTSMLEPPAIRRKDHSVMRSLVGPSLVWAGAIRAWREACEKRPR
ncbi:MAG TPA: hypothetical protein VGM27_27810, partial [Acidobacteriaceae bacterium]